jgi:hypothetical protein
VSARTLISSLVTEAVGNVQTDVSEPTSTAAVARTASGCSNALWAWTSLSVSVVARAERTAVPRTSISVAADPRAPAVRAAPFSVVVEELPADGQPRRRRGGASVDPRWTLRTLLRVTFQ